MPRPQKHRRICAIPQTQCFGPLTRPATNALSIVLTYDEYETIRLIDFLGLTQLDCARQMQVARTTVQSIYDGARKKLASALVEGRQVILQGGNYKLCSTAERCCGKNCGNRHCDYRRCEFMEGRYMKIAITYQDGHVFQHFGHTKQFKLYSIEDGKIAQAELVDAAGSGHGALAGFLKAHGVTALICGGIGGGAKTALSEANITVYPGVSGDVDAQITALLNGTLQFNPDTQCAHHHGEHGGHCHEHGADCQHQ